MGMFDWLFGKKKSPARDMGTTWIDYRDNPRKKTRRKKRSAARGNPMPPRGKGGRFVKMRGRKTRGNPYAGCDTPAALSHIPAAFRRASKYSDADLHLRRGPRAGRLKVIGCGTGSKQTMEYGGRKTGLFAMQSLDESGATKSAKVRYVPKSWLISTASRIRRLAAAKKAAKKGAKKGAKKSKKAVRSNPFHHTMGRRDRLGRYTSRGLRNNPYAKCNSPEALEFIRSRRVSKYADKTFLISKGPRAGMLKVVGCGIGPSSIRTWGNRRSGMFAFKRVDPSGAPVDKKIVYYPKAWVITTMSKRRKRGKGEALMAAVPSKKGKKGKKGKRVRGPSSMPAARWKEFSKLQRAYEKAVMAGDPRAEALGLQLREMTPDITQRQPTRAQMELPIYGPVEPEPIPNPSMRRDRKGRFLSVARRRNPYYSLRANPMYALPVRRRSR